MHQFVKVGLSLALGTVVGIAAGCGGKSGGDGPPPQDAFQQNVMNEVGEILVIKMNDSKKPPASAADLAKYEAGWPGGYKSVKDGSVVVAWGAPIVDGASDKVLAYEKQVPEAGGYVLMQDGKTVKKMTADQFKAAPKAGKG